MPDKDLDSTIAQDKKNPVELQGYVWFEIMDPTRIDDDPGMSFGRLFRMIDIRFNRTRNQPDWKGSYVNSSPQDADLHIKIARSYVEPL
ncbi:MAG: hypothetical protein GYA26_09730 [Flexilinea flocculi]|nr:hypothetical protein [Flexilinea flocculi]